MIAQRARLPFFPFRTDGYSLVLCLFFLSRCRSVLPTWRRDCNTVGHRVLTDPAPSSATKDFHFCFLLYTTYYECLFADTVAFCDLQICIPSPEYKFKVFCTHKQGRIAPGTPSCPEDINYHSWVASSFRQTVRATRHIKSS
ncbi:hypothetical protein V8C40DRAFT_250895 [Trichoderma camerunense]